MGPTRSRPRASLIHRHKTSGRPDASRDTQKRLRRDLNPDALVHVRTARFRSSPQTQVGSAEKLHRASVRSPIQATRRGPPQRVNHDGDHVCPPSAIRTGRLQSVTRCPPPAYQPGRLPGALPLSSGDARLGVGFPLRCFQRFALPNVATQRCRFSDNWPTSGSSSPVLSY